MSLGYTETWTPLRVFLMDHFNDMCSLSGQALGEFIEMWKTAETTSLYLSTQQVSRDISRVINDVVARVCIYPAMDLLSHPIADIGFIYRHWIHFRRSVVLHIAPRLAALSVAHPAMRGQTRFLPTDLRSMQIALYASLSNTVLSDTALEKGKTWIEKMMNDSETSTEAKMTMVKALSESIRLLTHSLKTLDTKTEAQVIPLKSMCAGTESLVATCTTKCSSILFGVIDKLIRILGSPSVLRVCITQPTHGRKRRSGRLPPYEGLSGTSELVEVLKSIGIHLPYTETFLSCIVAYIKTNRLYVCKWRTANSLDKHTVEGYDNLVAVCNTASVLRGPEGDIVRKATADVLGLFCDSLHRIVFNDLLRVANHTTGMEMQRALSEAIDSADNRICIMCKSPWTDTSFVLSLCVDPTIAALYDGEHASLIVAALIDRAIVTMTSISPCGCSSILIYIYLELAYKIDKSANFGSRVEKLLFERLFALCGKLSRQRGTQYVGLSERLVTAVGFRRWSSESHKNNAKNNELRGYSTYRDAVSRYIRAIQRFVSNQHAMQISGRSVVYSANMYLFEMPIVADRYAVYTGRMDKELTDMIRGQRENYAELILSGNNMPKSALLRACRARNEAAVEHYPIIYSVRSRALIAMHKDTLTMATVKLDVDVVFANVLLLFNSTPVASLRDIASAVGPNVDVLYILKALVDANILVCEGQGYTVSTEGTVTTQKFSVDTHRNTASSMDVDKANVSSNATSEEDWIYATMCCLLRILKSFISAGRHMEVESSELLQRAMEHPSFLIQQIPESYTQKVIDHALKRIIDRDFALMSTSPATSSVTYKYIP
jgi:hypothetical protein